MFIRAALSVLFLTSTLTAQLAPPASAPSDIYESVVRIEVATQVADYRTPWNSGRFSGGIGTGWIVGKNRIVTNAHVVSDARRLLVTKHGSPQKHPARVLHIAHDCDLAMLELEDFGPFEGLTELELGGLPQLESQVRVIGYPIGGDRISVTRGVVSRIDFSAYSHTRLDSHLVVQIDAAINPGNSGGPVLQNGKVVGVAFQGLTTADNTGYMIPVPVVARFLKDVEDGSYDNYVDLGLSEFSLFNPAMRAHYGLPDDGMGVLVANVLKGGATAGIIEKNDILMGIDGKPIFSDGTVTIDGQKVNMHEVVERKFAEDTITLDFIRDGKKMQAEATLNSFAPGRIYSVQYEKKPRYIVHGGLVFQPLDRNCFAAHGFKNAMLRYTYSKYTEEGIFEKKKDIVVLSTVLSDKLTTHVDGYSGLVVDRINGTEVTDLNHAFELLNSTPQDGFLKVELAGENVPIILPAADIPAANERIAGQYGVSAPHFLGQ